MWVSKDLQQCNLVLRFVEFLSTEILYPRALSANSAHSSLRPSIPAGAQRLYGCSITGRMHANEQLLNLTKRTPGLYFRLCSSHLQSNQSCFVVLVRFGACSRSGRSWEFSPVRLANNIEASGSEKKTTLLG
jgi:hypothetical protein